MRPRIERGNGVTRYLQLYAVLSRALSDGTIDPGSPLPSEPELVRRYRLSRTTVRRALGRLEREGRIVRRRGSGTFALSRPQPDKVRMLDGCCLEDLRRLAERTRARLIQFERVATPEFVRRVSPDFGDRALLIRRIRSFGGQPFLLSTHYVPERLAQRITRTRLGSKPVLMYLHEIGAHPAKVEQFTSAVAADVLAARYLRVGPDTPLVRAWRLVTDRRGRPVEFQELLGRPDLYEQRTMLELH